MECVAKQFDVLRRLQTQREAETILEIIDGDLNQAPMFSIFRVRQNPGIPTQNMAGRGGDGGQEGILDIRTLEWTPISRGQAATGMNQNGMDLASRDTDESVSSAKQFSLSGMYQGANSSTADSLPNSNQALVEQRQGLGETGGLRMNRAALERVARLALEELARRER